MKLLSSILFLIISITLFFTVIDPFYGQIKSLRADVDKYNKALDNSTNLQKTRDSLVEIYKRIKQEDKDRLNHLLPNNIENIELILEIEKIANLHGLPVGNIRFDTKSLEDKSSSSTGNTQGGGLSYGVFPIDFTIEGKYDTFISFLKDLEKNLRLVDVKSISFNSTSSVTSLTGLAISNNVYNYTLKVQTYWLK